MTHVAMTDHGNMFGAAELAPLVGELRACPTMTATGHEAQTFWPRGTRACFYWPRGTQDHYILAPWHIGP